MEAASQCVCGRRLVARWWVAAIALLTVQVAARAQVQIAANLPAASNEAVFREEASPKRIMGVVPNFQTTNASAATELALTPKQKFILATHNAFDISAHAGNAFQSAVQQAVNGQPNYGIGWGAYGKRFAAAEADQITGSYLTYAILPTIFHEDPRYFRLGRGSAKSRIWYALSRSVLTRRDGGGWTFNKSQVIGQFIACEISTTYYPAQDRNSDGVTLNWAVNMAYKSGYNLLSEYYPDLVARLHHAKKTTLATALHASL